MGCRQKAGRTIKIQNLRDKHNFLAQVTFHGMELGERSLISSLWETQHCSDNQGTVSLGRDKVLHQGNRWLS